MSILKLRRDLPIVLRVEVAPNWYCHPRAARPRPACAVVGSPSRKSANALPSARPAAEEVQRGVNEKMPRAPFGFTGLKIVVHEIGAELERVRCP